MLGQGSGGGLARALDGGHVRRDGKAQAAALTDRGGSVGETVGVACDRDDVGSGVGKHGADLGADPLGGAGDERPAAGQRKAVGPGHAVPPGRATASAVPSAPKRCSRRVGKLSPTASPGDAGCSPSAFATSRSPLAVRR